MALDINNCWPQILHLSTDLHITHDAKDRMASLDSKLIDGQVQKQVNVNGQRSIMAIRCFTSLIFNLDLFYCRIVMKPSSVLCYIPHTVNP